MKKILLSTACVSVIAFVAAPAIAQPAAAPPSASPAPAAPAPAAAAAPQSATLGEIVVTAQRRSENLQKAAIAVSAVTGDTLRQSGVTKPTELTSVVPSLQVAPSAGPYSLFYLRGVGNFSGNALSDAAVAFNFNGVYIGRPSSTTGYFYDLERVEVVKGPQGTLYGRNATGGAVNVIPKAPQLGVTSGELVGEYGNYNASRIDGDVNLPIGDNTAVRAAGVWVKHDGYMNDGTDDQNDLGGRLSLRYKPNDRLTVSLSGDLFQSQGHGIGSTPLAFNPDDRIGISSPQGQAYFASQPNVLLGRTFAPITSLPTQDNRFWGVSSTIEWRSDFGTLTLIPGYRHADLNYISYVPGFQIHQTEHDDQTSVEARFATDDTKQVRLLVGGFYYDETNKVPFAQYSSQAQVSNQQFAQDTTSYAGFGRITYAPVPEFRITIGGRYTSDDKRFDGVLTSMTRACVIPTSYFPTYVPGCPTAQPIPYASMALPFPNFIPGADGTVTIPGGINNTGANAKHATFDRFTYRVGADWDITSRNLLYASYETGFKAGGFFFSGDQGTFQPEDIDAYTVGSKNRFLDNRLQLNFEGFYWFYKNQQISHLGLDSQGNLIFPTENVGRATMRGIEVDGQFLLTPTSLLTGDIQYLDAVYDNFIYRTPNTNGGVSNGTGCPSQSVTSINYTVNCSGFGPPNSPRWTINLGGQQTFPLANGGKLVANLKAHYQTRVLTGLEFTPIEYQSAYWLADASLTYGAPNDRYFVTGFVNNMFNQTAVSSSYPPTFALFTVGTLRPPRTYGIRVGARF